MKKKILIASGLIVVIAAVTITMYIKHYEKQSEEYYTFREDVLDEVYFPVLHDTEDFYDEMFSVTPSVDSWYLIGGGEEKNDEILNRLEKAKSNIEYYKLTNPNAVELKKIVMNNIDNQIDLHETIKLFGDTDDLSSIRSNGFFSEGMEKINTGIKKMNESLGVYYSN